jgi:hypothetical protein
MVGDDEQLANRSFEPANEELQGRGWALILADRFHASIFSPAARCNWTFSDVSRAGTRIYNDL